MNGRGLAQYITLIFALSCGLCTVTSVLSPPCNERRVHCIPCRPHQHCRSVRHGYGSRQGGKCPDLLGSPSRVLDFVAGITIDTDDLSALCSFTPRLRGEFCCSRSSSDGESVGLQLPTLGTHQILSGLINAPGTGRTAVSLHGCIRPLSGLTAVTGCISATIPAAVHHSRRRLRS
jgi:hypothetical protein